MTDRPVRIQFEDTLLAQRASRVGFDSDPAREGNRSGSDTWPGLLGARDDRLFLPAWMRRRRTPHGPDSSPPQGSGDHGDYQVHFEQELGSGGLANVYRGHDLRDGRPVAIKILKEAYFSDPAQRARFQRERHMMRDNRHRVLLKAYQHIQTSTSSWIVMELIEGRSLKDIVAEDGAFAPREVRRILLEVLAGLDELHGRGIVHLDIKPQNILRSDRGSLRLIDFGLAQEAWKKQEKIGEFTFGTAAYLSPEQGSGMDVDGRSDIYSLGCVAYELVTGRAPFAAPEGPDQHRRLIDQHVNDEPAAPMSLRREVPVAVSDMVMKAIAKRPADRYQSANHFAQAVGEAFGGRGHRQGSTLPLEPAAATAGSARSPVVRFGTAFARGAVGVVRAAVPRLNPIRRPIWRPLVSAMFLMAILVAWQGPESLVERGLALGPGMTTEVAVNELNLRSGPTEAATILAQLPVGAELRMIGLSETTPGRTWWEVQWTSDDGVVQGWVWDGGLVEGGWPSRLHSVQGGVDWVESQRDRVAGVYETATGWWPFS